MGLTIYGAGCYMCCQGIFGDERNAGGGDPCVSGIGGYSVSFSAVCPTLAYRVSDRTQSDKFLGYNLYHFFALSFSSFAGW